MYTRWEYCRLEVENPPYAPPSGVQLAVTLTWLGATGYQVPIATVGDESSWSLDINPWDFAIGALGEAGWEMVSIQHADQTASTSEFSYATAIAWDRAIAVFKRPKLSGRPIDDLSLLT